MPPLRAQRAIAKMEIWGRGGAHLEVVMVEPQQPEIVEDREGGNGPSRQ